MATHVDRAGRVKDILLFMHRNYLVDGQWVTVGDYARFAHISKSPHLRQIFAQLCEENIVRCKDESYRGTIVRTFAVNYEYVSGFYPHIRHILTEIGWQEELV